MAGATAGNLILMHTIVRGTVQDHTFTNITNLENAAGTDNLLSGVISGRSLGNPITSNQQIHLARVMANGTVSVDLVVGASGEDMFSRMFEFSGASLGTTVATVLENGAGVGDDGNGFTNTTVTDFQVVTNGNDRLALNFVGIDNNQATTAFTGETGGDWTEVVAEFASATGATATLQLQSAAMSTAGTIDGGTFTITSAGWNVMGTAIIPIPPPGPGLRTSASPLRW